MKWYKHLRWYHVFLLPLAVILVPIIVWVGLCDLLTLPKQKKEYHQSPYYTDLHKPYCRGILQSPGYRFYNSAKERNLPVTYVGQDNGAVEAFVYENRLYLIPEIDQLFLDEESGSWNVDYDGDHKPLEEAYKELCASVSSEMGSALILVERNMIPMEDLRGVRLPESVFLTWSYEKAFEDEDSPLKLRIPRNTEELYEMLEQTPDLCRNYCISPNGSLLWDLYEGVQVEIAVDPSDSFVSLNTKICGKWSNSLTHWHPVLYEVYIEAREMGTVGNVLVVRKFLSACTVLYMGSKGKCLYAKGKKTLFGKLYYLEAKE